MEIEKVDGFKLAKHELELELGQGANFAEISAQADLISNKWELNEKPKKPLLLMLGGFQGSGKTTTLDALVPGLNLLIISPDEIRHNLFTQQFPFSEEFVKLVNATKIELVKRALATGNSLVIDQALTPDRVTLTKKLLQEHPEYRFFSVFLTSHPDILRKRVSQRPSLGGRYRGTVEELESSMNNYTSRYGNPENSGYDLLIDSSTNNPQSIATIIQSRLK